MAKDEGAHMEGQATVMEAKVGGTKTDKLLARAPASGPQVPSAWPTRLALLGASLATSGLLWLSYFPVACGWLAWFALVPLLALVRSGQRPRFLFLCAWLSGIAFFQPALWWMHAADGLWSAPLSLGPMTAAAYFLGLYCALYFPAAVFLLRWLERRTALPLVLTLPAVWTGLEFVRGFFGTGFPWYFLGHSQHDFLPIIQVADLAGAYAVSFLVAAVNAAAFEWLYAVPPLRTFLGLREPAGEPAWRRHVALTAAVGVLILAALIYGGWRLGQDEFRPGPRLALLQGNLDQRLRNRANAPGPEAKTARATILRHYDSLCQEAAKQQPRPNLIVWPETSFPGEWLEITPAAEKKLFQEWDKDRSRNIYQLYERNRALFGRSAADCGTNLLLGLLTFVLSDPDQKPDRYNSALLVTPAGAVGGRYDKMHRVPFGEYVPLRDWLPFMNALSPYDFDYSIGEGTQFTRFPLGDYRFGVLICYEDGDPKLARQYARETEDGPPADFLIEISNDGWFDGTAEHEEHLAICRFRAVETRRSIARAVNMGISGVIDGNGRVLRPAPLFNYDPDTHLWNVAAEAGPLPDLPVSEWRDFKKCQGILLATVPLDGRTSLYARWGDWLPWGCWLAVGTCLVTAWLRRRAGAVRPRREAPGPSSGG
jgi:apolipoprotein N-acyltransferase